MTAAATIAVCVSVAFVVERRVDNIWPAYDMNQHNDGYLTGWRRWIHKY